MQIVAIFAAGARRLVVGALFLPTLALALPTEPPAGTLTPDNPSLTFTGGPTAGANASPASGDHVCETGQLECDVFMLSVDASSLPEGSRVGLRIAVEWQGPNAAGDDFDIYLVDAQSGDTEASAASAANPEVIQYDLDALTGDFTVDIVPFLVAGAEYTGTVELIVAEATPGADDPTTGDPATDPDAIAMACDAAFAGLDVGASVATVDPSLPLQQTTRVVLTFANRASSLAAAQRLADADVLSPAVAAAVYELRHLYFVVIPRVFVTQALIADLRALLDGTDLISIWGSHPRTMQIDTSAPYIGVAAAREAFATDGLPLTGQGVGVGVIDTGWDTTQGDFDNLPMASGVRMAGADAIEAPNTETNQGHGTHIVGTIAGDGAQSEARYVGLAPAVNMLSVAVDGAFPYLFTVEGIDYLISQRDAFNLRVSNHSYGPGTGSGFRFNPASPDSLAAKRSLEAGIIQVHSAGNLGPNEDTIGPAAQNPCVIAVANGDRTGQLADSSSRGTADGSIPGPDITAPGTTITASRAINGATSTRTPNIPDVNYATISGTSMAAPHIVATVAIMLEANPTLGFGEVLAILRETARPMARADGTPYAPFEVGAGYVDVLGAVAAALGQPRPDDPPPVLPGPGTTRVLDVAGKTGQTAIGVCFGCPTGDAGFGVHRYVYDLPTADTYDTMEVSVTWPKEVELFSLELFGPDGQSLGKQGSDVLAGDLAPTVAATKTLTITVDDPQPGMYLVDVKEDVTQHDTFRVTMDVTCPDDTGCGLQMADVPPEEPSAEPETPDTEPTAGSTGAFGVAWLVSLLLVAAGRRRAVRGRR